MNDGTFNRFLKLLREPTRSKKGRFFFGPIAEHLNARLPQQRHRLTGALLGYAISSAIDWLRDLRRVKIFLKIFFFIYFE
jgi:hypothetical protein